MVATIAIGEIASTNNMYLYTVIISFSDFTKGIGQYETNSPVDGLKRFIEKSESLKGFDRETLSSAIGDPPLIQMKDFKGFWLARFDSRLLTTITGPNDNRILGGHIIQSDPNGGLF